MYEILINIIIIHIRIIFFFNIYNFVIINKKLIFFTTQTTKFMKLSMYDIDSYSFTNVGILNILNKSYRSNYILQCVKNILYFS